MSKKLLFSYGDYEDYPAMEAVLFAMRENGIIVEIESLLLGEEIFKQGFLSGYFDDALQKVKRVRILLKSPTKSPGEYDLPREVADEEAPHLHISEEQTQDKFFISRNLCEDLDLKFAMEESDDHYMHGNEEIFIFEPKSMAPEAMFKTAKKALEKLDELE